MLVLGIESSCDDTSIALVADGITIVALSTYSQEKIHAQYGGVFPQIAAKHHASAITFLLKEILTTHQIGFDAIDLIAVTQGPGLMGSLHCGMNLAKTIAITLNKPIVGVNHVDAHVYAAMMSAEMMQFPALGIVLSGGHTYCAYYTSPTKYKVIAATVDDALGEAFDKVGKMLGLPYPGGPAIETMALSGDPSRFLFKAGTVKTDPFLFSYSGLKTNVLYTTQMLTKDDGSISTQDITDIAASFQQAIMQDMSKKIRRILAQHPVKAIYFGGGVVQNQTLRDYLQQEIDIPLFWPAARLSVDNAAMIAGFGYHIYQESGAHDPIEMVPFPRSSMHKYAFETIAN